MFGRILVLSPHTDDGELGCGGAIAKFVEEGEEVHYVAFSAAEKAVPKEFPDDVLRQEVEDATSVLGIEPHNLYVLDFEVRSFPQSRQEILAQMIKLKETIGPELVLLPSSYDIHQDHHTIYEEGLRAFKRVSMLGYELPWNNLIFETKSFVYLEERHLKKKIVAVKCYASQSRRKYAREEFLISLARCRGTQIGATYAEAFEVVRWIMK